MKLQTKFTFPVYGGLDAKDNRGRVWVKCENAFISVVWRRSEDVMPPHTIERHLVIVLGFFIL